MTSKKKGSLLIITGPSGSGKDSVANGIIESTDFKRIVTYTSRPKREYEIDGVHYHFCKKVEFERKIKNNELLEYVEYGLHYKGTHKDSVSGILSGEKLVWVIDMSRAAVVKDLFYEKYNSDIADLIWGKTKVVLLDVPDWGLLRKRIEQREGKLMKDAEKRFTQDLKVKNSHEFMYTLMNLEGELEKTLLNLKELIGG